MPPARTIDELISSTKVLVVDMYDPMHLEHLELGREEEPRRRRQTLKLTTAVMNDQLLRGDGLQARVGARPGDREAPAHAEPDRAQTLRVETRELPIERAGRYFYSRRMPDQNQSVLYMRRKGSDKDEILVDPNPMNADEAGSIIASNPARYLRPSQPFGKRT